MPLHKLLQLPYCLAERDGEFDRGDDCSDLWPASGDAADSENDDDVDIFDRGEEFCCNGGECSDLWATSRDAKDSTSGDAKDSTSGDAKDSTSGDLECGAVGERSDCWTMLQDADASEIAAAERGSLGAVFVVSDSSDMTLCDGELSTESQCDDSTLSERSERWEPASPGGQSGKTKTMDVL